MNKKTATPGTILTPGFLERNSNRDSKGHLEEASILGTSEKYNSLHMSNLENTKIVAKEQAIGGDYDQARQAESSQYYKGDTETKFQQSPLKIESPQEPPTMLNGYANSLPASRIPTVEKVVASVSIVPSPRSKVPPSANSGLPPSTSGYIGDNQGSSRLPLRKKSEGHRHRSTKHPSKKKPCKQCGHESADTTTDYGNFSEPSNGPHRRYIS